MILINRFIFYKNYVGLCLWPFIILKERELTKDSVLINHERIHLRQQQELLILPFYFFYMLEWLFRTLWYFDAYKAYRNISFEREAYTHEGELHYLSDRSRFRFIKYL